MTTLKAQGGSGPIEVWLTQGNIEVKCGIVFEGETSADQDVDSLSMRGAQREMTSFLLDWGYEAAGRWENEEVTLGGDVLESVRRFRPAKQKASA